MASTCSFGTDEKKTILIFLSVTPWYVAPAFLPPDLPTHGGLALARIRNCLLPLQCAVLAAATTLDLVDPATLSAFPPPPPTAPVALSTAPAAPSVAAAWAPDT